MLSMSDPPDSQDIEIVAEHLHHYFWSTSGWFSATPSNRARCLADAERILRGLKERKLIRV